MTWAVGGSEHPVREAKTTNATNHRIQSVSVDSGQRSRRRMDSGAAAAPVRPSSHKRNPVRSSRAGLGRCSGRRTSWSARPWPWRVGWPMLVVDDGAARLVSPLGVMRVRSPVLYATEELLLVVRQPQPDPPRISEPASIPESPGSMPHGRGRTNETRPVTQGLRRRARGSERAHREHVRRTVFEPLTVAHRSHGGGDLGERVGRAAGGGCPAGAWPGPPPAPATSHHPAPATSTNRNEKLRSRTNRERSFSAVRAQRDQYGRQTDSAKPKSPQLNPGSQSELNTQVS